ncbi:MAG: tetratricopeptide repeat protein [Anaerolineae bacterium]|nr:tetratricopeptide repeat protein [Anaerolineae bacterium]
MTTTIPFIDREVELTLVDQAIRARNTRCIIGVQADGGVGKTRLLQEIQHRYRDTAIGRELDLCVTDILDFDDRANLIPQNVGRRIAQMLGAQFFKPYLRGLLNYQQYEKAGVHYARLQEVEKENNAAFVKCLNEATRRRRVVMLVDTAEKLQLNVGYLFDWIQQSKNVVWILVGRDNSALLQWIASYQNDDIRFVELKDLSPASSAQYLEAKQQSLHITLAPDLVANLLLLAQGRPILIDLAVEWLARNIPLPWLKEYDVTQLIHLSTNEKRQEFERQLVLSIADMRRRMDRLILAMAYIRYPFSAELVSSLLHLSSVDAESLFQEAQTYVFVKQLPDGRLTLHDEMHRMVEAYVWPEVDPDDERRREYSGIFISYVTQQEKSLKAQITQLQTTSEAQILSTQDAEAELTNSLHRQTLERELGVVQESLLQHTLFVDVAQGIETFARLFDEATRSYNFERRELFYRQMQTCAFDALSLDLQYTFYSRKIRYLNDVGQFDEAQTLATMLLKRELKIGQRLDLLTLSGHSYELAHSLLDAMKQYEKALGMCEYYPDELTKWKGQMLSNLGRVTREMRRTDAAFEYYKQALFIAEKPEQIAAILNSMGYVWSLQGRYRGALGYCSKALSIYKELQQQRAVGTTLTTIGEVYRNQGHYQQAIDHYNHAQRYFERENDLIWLARVRSFRGAVYRLQRRFLEAEQDLRESLRYNIKAIQPWTYHVLGCVYWDQDQWDSAEEQFRTSDQLALEIHDVRTQVNNLVGYAELYFDRWAASELKDPAYPPKIRAKAEELDNLLKQGYGFEHHHGRMLCALADVAFYEKQYEQAFTHYKAAFTLLGSRLGGYARLREFKDEVDWLAARIIDLADIGEPERALAWCQAFREHWQDESLHMMQADLLASMCDICEIEIKLKSKD